MVVTYRVVPRADVPSVVDALADLYAMVYAEPPYSEGPEQVAGFRHSLIEDTARDGFELIVAEAEADGALVGAVYGWTMPASRWWSRADGPGPGDVVAADKLAVMEWMVHPAHRNHDVGAKLMRRLLANRPEEWATLASDPRSAAHGMYQRTAWVQVGESKLPWGPVMHLLVRRLRGVE